MERETKAWSDHVSYGAVPLKYWSIYRLISRPTLDQVSVEYQPCSGRCSVDISVEYRPIYRPTLLSVDIVGVHRYFTHSVPILHRVHRSIYLTVPQYRSTYWPVVDRYPAGSWPITYRYGHGRYVGRHQWKLDQNIGWLSVDSVSTCRSHVGRESIEYRSRYPKRYMVPIGSTLLSHVS